MANTNVDAIAVRLFIAQAKADYQSMGSNLPKTAMLRTNVVGETIQYPKIGSVISNEVGFSKAVDPQDPGTSNVVGTMKKFNASITLDPVQAQFLNIQIRQDFSRLLTFANSRRMDQVMIDAIDAEAGVFTIPTGATNLTYDKLLQVVQNFDDLEVPEEDRFILAPPKAQRALMNDVKFINNEFVNKGPVSNGEINQSKVLGMTMITIAQRTEGGLPLTGDIATCFAYSRTAVGFGIGIEADINVSIEPTLSMAMLLQANMSLNSTIIDAEGLTKIDVDITKNI